MGTETTRTDVINWALLKEELRNEASRLGVDRIGFASAEPFEELKTILVQHRQKGYESGFEEPDLDKRVNPALSLEAPRSIVSIAVAYPSKLKSPPRSEPGAIGACYPARHGGLIITMCCAAALSASRRG